MPTRAGTLKLVVAAVLAAAGVAGGFYLGTFDEPGPTPDGRGAPSRANARPTRFPLSTFDTHERNEAPELAVDATGRVFLVWASQDGPETRVLLLSQSDDEGRNFSAPRAVAHSGIVRTVSPSKNMTVTRESKMAPHLSAQGDNLALAWTESL